MSTPPSGEQIHLTRDNVEAVVVSVGGGLRTLTVAGLELLEGYAEAEMCSAARGQLLLPWPNRLRDGRYVLHGQTHQLALSEPEKHNAIHGLSRWAEWTTIDRTGSTVTLVHLLRPQPGYPFTLAQKVEHRLVEGGIEVTVSQRNQGEDACPVGAGAHPYLVTGGGLLDDCGLQLRAAVELTTDDRQIPTGERPVTDEHDFRIPRRLGSVVLDTAYGQLEPEADGTVIRFERTDRRTVSVRVDATHGYLMAFTGDSLGDPSRRRHGLGVEPMTCAPDAFNSGAGVRVLKPGEALTSRWSIILTD